MAARDQWMMEAAEVVEGMLSVAPSGHTLILISMSTVMHHLPLASRAKVYRLLDDCLFRRPSDPPIPVAAGCSRGDLVLRSEASTPAPSLPDRFWSGLFMYLVAQNSWAHLGKLVACSQRSPPEVLRWFARNRLSDEALAVFDVLLKNCSTLPESLLRDIMNSVTSRGLVRQYKLLIYSENDVIRQYRSILGGYDRAGFPSGSLVNIVRQTCLSRLIPERFPGKALDYNRCLALACEAGLLTMSRQPDNTGRGSRPTLISLAVQFKQLDVVSVLFTAGATTNRELFQMARHTAQAERSEADGTGEGGQHQPPARAGFRSFPDVDVPRDIRLYLADAASQPRSLYSLCILEVSRLVGFGSARESNIGRLEIADGVKADLKFKGIGTLLAPRKIIEA